MHRLLAEWAPQRAVQLCWPSQADYWQQQLTAAQRCHSQIMAHISQYQSVLLLVASDCDLEQIRSDLKTAGANLGNVHFYQQDNNDIWCRDYGPISRKSGESQNTNLVDFVFTGWGGKFPAEKDNAATPLLAQQQAYGALKIRSESLILEGGAIDSDGQGCLLTTEACLLNPNRNPDWDKSDYEQFFQQTFGVQRVHWLSQGWLAGDDTDSHVDMLARFASADCIVYQGCQNPDDEHYQPLQALAQELSELLQLDGGNYDLVELPFPQAQFNAEGDRLPASYANFLITNQQVLVPAYGCEQDQEAVDKISALFPQREVISINCQALIHQYGSLHCATMQIAD